MYSFEKCHFCNSKIKNNNCSNDICSNQYEYQTYPDLNLIDFYLGKYIFEIYYNQDNTPKAMKIIESGEVKSILDVDYHIEVNEKSYLDLINRIEKLNIIT